MKRFILPLVCLAVGISIGWYFGYTRPTAKNQRELLEQYRQVRDDFHLTDAQMAEYGAQLPEMFVDIRRTDELAAAVAFNGIVMLSRGEVASAEKYAIN